jgi:effector-binding domain-containing protein
VLESQPYEYIRNELLFGPGGGGGTGSWNFIESNNITNVTWTIHITNLSYPNNRWMGLFIEMMLEPVMAEGLARLKKRAESLPDPPNIKVVELDVQPSLLIPDSATMEEMEVMLQENFKKLFDYISYMKIPITGQQFSIIHSWNPEGVSRISTGVPVEKDAKPWQDIKYFEIPATKAVFAIHTGGPNTGKTHYAIDDYIKDFGLETKDYVWETYLYDPVMQPDTTQWTTWIYYPLK